MRRIVLIIICLLLGTVESGLPQEPVRILIAYYSQEGHTRAMAEAVHRGAASVSGVRAVLRSVDSVAISELLAADAIIVGSPVYNANVAPAVQEFINRWPFQGSPLKDKIGAAFTTGGGISAGEELVQVNLLHSMLIFGMIVVGGPHWQQPFGASAVTEEPPFEPKTSRPPVHRRFLQKGEALGKRVASLAVRWKRAGQR